jgi:hypothetical protein
LPEEEALLGEPSSEKADDVVRSTEMKPNAPFSDDNEAAAAAGPAPPESPSKENPLRGAKAETGAGCTRADDGAPRARAFVRRRIQLLLVRRPLLAPPSVPVVAVGDVEAAMMLAVGDDATALLLLVLLLLTILSNLLESTIFVGLEPLLLLESWLELHAAAVSAPATVVGSWLEAEAIEIAEKAEAVEEETKREGFSCWLPPAVSVVELLTAVVALVGSLTLLWPMGLTSCPKSAPGSLLRPELEVDLDESEAEELCIIMSLTLLCPILPPPSR